MSSLNGQNLFNSGPHTIRTGSWQRCVERRSFGGLDGELLLDMGMRSRIIVQKGRLQDQALDDLQTIISQIETLVNGQLYALVDNHGRTFSKVLLEHFETTTPIRKGRSFWCEYNINYRQLP